MTARDLMSSPPYTCQPGTDLAEVTRVMWDHDCGFVPVVDGDGHVAGVITDRDICVAAATRRLKPEQISASQAMTPSVLSCLPDDRVEDLLATMAKRQVRRVPVVDAHGQLQGVISLNDIVRAAGKKGGPSAANVVTTLSSICSPRGIEAVVA